MIKITKINSSLKCDYFKVEDDNQSFFRKELYLKETPWTIRFLKEIEFYENVQNLKLIQKYLPVMVFADKMNYQLDLVFIESKKTSLSRYVTKIPDNLLSMFCDFSLSCIQYHQKDEKLDYILSKVEKVKKSNFLI